VGCADGPIPETKILNPWVRKQWAEDEQRVTHILDLAVKTLDGTVVDKSPVETDAPAPTWTQRRALAMLDLLEAGLAHLQEGNEVDVEAAVVNVMCEYDVLVERVAGSDPSDPTASIPSDDFYFVLPYRRQHGGGPVHPHQRQADG